MISLGRTGRDVESAAVAFQLPNACRIKTEKKSFWADHMPHQFLRSNQFVAQLNPTAQSGRCLIDAA